MKKTFVAIALLLTLNTNVGASGFGAISVGKSLTDVDIEGYKYEDRTYVKISAGTLGYPKESLRMGGYAEIGGSLSDNSETIKNDITAEYRSLIINIGMTYAISHNIYILGGVGIENSSLLTQNNITDKEEEFGEKTKFNGNIGTLLYLQGYGIHVSFDTAPQVLSIGLSHKF